VNRKKMTFVLVVVILLVVAGISAVFINYRKMMTRGEAQLAKLSEDVSISIGTVHHTSTRDGIIEWQIDAKSAEYIPERQEVLFKDLNAIFFVENDRKITLIADQGTLKKDTNDIEVTGNVLVIDDMFQLKTSRLAYEHQSRVMSTSTRVEVKSDSWDLEADSMKLDLNTRKTRFEGKVKGIFSEMFSL
jgi:LPS export ABC transporter protein LptC